MLVPLCALLALTAMVQEISPREITPQEISPLGIHPERQSPRILYEKAAQEIRLGQAAAALEHLEELHRQYPSHPIAERSTQQLAECYLINDRPEAALGLLEEHLSSNAPSSPSEQIEKLIELAELACRQLPANEQSTALIAQFVSNSKIAARINADHFRRLRFELAHRHARQHDFASARACLDDFSSDPATAQFRYRLLLAAAGQEICAANLELAADLLREIQLQAMNSAEMAAVGLQLVEALVGLGRIDEALQELEKLQSSTNLSSAYEAAMPPGWFASVQLRRAELLVMSKQYRAAKELIAQVQPLDEDFQLAHEFHFLLARCAIAEIDFSNADRHLQAIVSARPAVREAVAARAVWLQGEVYFLQREYAQALKHYAQVAARAAIDEWTIRGTLQASKCQELLGKPLQAIAGYQRVLDACASLESQNSIDSATPLSVEIAGHADAATGNLKLRYATALADQASVRIAMLTAPQQKPEPKTTHQPNTNP